MKYWLTKIIITFEGCCSHVASLILYLSHGQYVDTLPMPGSSIMPLLSISFNKKQHKTYFETKSFSKKSLYQNISQITSTQTIPSSKETQLTETNCMKRIASATFTQQKNKHSSFQDKILSNFRSRVPKWGGNVKFQTIQADDTTSQVFKYLFH